MKALAQPPTNRKPIQAQKSPVSPIAPVVTALTASAATSQVQARGVSPGSPAASAPTR